MRCIARRLTQLLRSRNGNFGIITGLAAVPIIMALGGAVDMQKLYSASVQAQDAADAAALTAAKRAEGGDVAAAKAEADSFGRARLSKDTTGITFTQVIDVAAGKVTVTARGQVETSFLKIVQIDSLPFERVAGASIRRKGYIDFHFLLDVSESMNIAADDVERKKLEAISKASNNRPCAFACHIVEGNFGPLSVFQMNENAGAKKARLRINVLQDAADAMIETLISLNSEPQSLLNIRVHTNGFGTTFEPGVGPSTNVKALRDSIRNFKIGNGHTSFNAAMPAFSKALGTQGNGATQNAARKVALLITDGVRDDHAGFARSGLGPIAPELCDLIKSKGIELAVLEIKYVENYDVGNYYKDRVAWYYPQISSNLKSCASPGLYYFATESRHAEKQLISLSKELVTQKVRINR